MFLFCSARSPDVANLCLFVPVPPTRHVITSRRLSVASALAVQQQAIAPAPVNGAPFELWKDAGDGLWEIGIDGNFNVARAAGYAGVPDWSRCHGYMSRMQATGTNLDLFGRREFLAHPACPRSMTTIPGLLLS